MRKTIFTLAIAVFVTAATFMSCKSPTKEEKEAQENVNEANEELVEARKEATEAEWEAFKHSGDSIIDRNDERIAELKRDMKKAGKSIDAHYQESVDALEQKNKDLKAKMEGYKNDANSDWQSFKREFNHDMDELGQAFKDLTVNNKK